MFEKGIRIKDDLGVGMRERARRTAELKVGDKVVTDYAGRITPHTITETDRWVKCESGLAFKVKPPVPKSAGSWMDSGWFLPAADVLDVK